MFKKKCELLFIDSSPTGRIFCGLSNWDGVCLRIPKSRLLDCPHVEELNQVIHYTGVYFLVGGEPGEEIIYVGEAENIYDRLKQHIAEDDWQEVYVATRKGNSLNKAHVKYLEHCFYKKAIEAKRYKVLNKNTPTQSSISHYGIADMEEFIYYTVMLVGLLGCKAFDSLSDKVSPIGDLFIKSVGLVAQAKMLDGEFVVLKGSQSRAEFRKASNESLRKKWRKLRDDGIVVNNQFVQDYAFSSSSTAAAVVLGRNANGLTEWKNKAGITMKELLENKG